MAIPSCDPWGANTIRASERIVASRETTPRAGEYELEEETFLALVLDSVQRLAVKGVTGFPNLSTAEVCDLDANAHNAYVQVNPVSLPIQSNSAQLKAYVLWALGQALCANSA